MSAAALSRWLRPCLALAAVLLAAGSVRAAGPVSLAGVHWYSGDSSMLDLSVPAGERGWNVEVVFDTGWCDGDPATDPGGVRSVAATAKAQGLVNIIRVDYRQLVAVPTSAGEYGSWASNFIKCTQELSDLSSLFIVGNEPNIEGNIPADGYASAFNYLYSRKAEMPAGTQLLATFNSPFTPPGWMLDMSSRLAGVDGFVLHTGGVRSNCGDPRQPCSYGGWAFDGAFRYYRDVIASINSGWWTRPVYITEFNTYTGDPGSEPDSNYPANWINQAFEEIRGYNASRGSKPPVKALCWFVDRPQSWPRFALRNIAAARTDMGEEFKNPANRGGAGTPPPSGTNVARGAVAWSASSSYSVAFGGDKAYDGVVSAASKWTSNGSSIESWLALDLGRANDLTGFIVRHAGSAGELKGYNTQAFRLESGTSLSGPWTTLASVRNAAQDDTSTVVLASPVTTRYVRLYVTDAGIDNYARIPELEVYGVPATSSCLGSAPPDHWKGEYFGNQTLSGTPSMVRDDGTAGLSLDWASGSPSSACGIGADHFSTRWTRTLSFAAGTYRFNTRTDDGVRLYVDDVLRIDKWIDRAAPAVPDSVDVTLGAGNHTLRMEFYENGGLASAELAWQAIINHPPTAIVSASPTSGPAPLTVAFNGAGSSDPDGDALTYSWSFGDGSQGSGATVSHTYSAAGNYTATLTVDDGRGGSNGTNVAITALAAAAGLVNGDFESSTPGSALGTGWIAFSSAGYNPVFAVVSDQVHGGSFAQRVTSPQPSSNDKYSGVYQVVATQPGGQYTARAWNRTHFTGGTAWDHIARLGIDLQGGNDFQAPSVQWLEFDSAKDTWHPLETVVTATGGSTTIYLESWRKWASGGDSLTWFDDVQVLPKSPPPVNHPPTAAAAANPLNGTAPLTVAFNGTGSSDPDGDPLSYGWSFGDGSHATGATVSHTYSVGGTYAATLTVDDGRGGTHSATVTITVDNPSGNRPPTAVISASPRSATIPFTVTLDGRGSTDPDGDPLTYGWSFADGVQGSGPTMQRAFEDANVDMKEAGGYLVTLTVSDGKGGTGSASVRIGVFPPGCPSSLDFDTIRAQLDAQGKDLEFVKIGFHTGGGGTFGGLGKWERCLDAAGVPFTVKQVPSAHNASVGEAAQLKARSGVPHTIIYRKCCDEYELPACGLADWNTCTDAIAQQEAHNHWQLHLHGPNPDSCDPNKEYCGFPPEVVDNKQSIWVETINEPWKGSNTRNNAEWLAKFSYYTALEAMAAGYNYAAFGWSTGEPQYGPRPPDEPMSPEFQWDGPEMQNFLRLATQHPDRIAISLHEYDLTKPTLRDTYPDSIGRLQKLFERCDANGIGRPTVVITEFGWPDPQSVSVMSPDNVPWAAGLYAGLRPLKGVALWDAGDMSSIISGMTAYALQNYFAIPK